MSDDTPIDSERRDDQTADDGSVDGDPADEPEDDVPPVAESPDTGSASTESAGTESVDAEPVDTEPSGVGSVDDESIDTASTCDGSLDGEPVEIGSVAEEDDPSGTGERRVGDDGDTDSDHVGVSTPRVRLFNANEGDLLLDTAEQTSPSGDADGESSDGGIPAVDSPDDDSPDDDYGPADVRRDYRDDVRLFADPERGVVTVYCNVNRIAPEQVLARVTVEPGPLPVVLGRARAAVDRTLAVREWPVVAGAEQPVFDVLESFFGSATARDGASEWVYGEDERGDDEDTGDEEIYAGDRDDGEERERVDEDEERDGAEGECVGENGNSESTTYGLEDYEDAAAAEALDEALGAVNPDDGDAVTRAELVASSRATVVTPGERAAARLLPVACRRWPDDTTLSVAGSPSDGHGSGPDATGDDAETDGAASRVSSPDVVLRPDVAADTVRLASDTRRELAARRRRRLRVVTETLSGETPSDVSGVDGDTAETVDATADDSAPAGMDASHTDAGSTSAVLGSAARDGLPTVLATVCTIWVVGTVTTSLWAAVAGLLVGSLVSIGGPLVRDRAAGDRR